MDRVKLFIFSLLFVHTFTRARNSSDSAYLCPARDHEMFFVGFSSFCEDYEDRPAIRCHACINQTQCILRGATSSDDCKWQEHYEDWGFTKRNGYYPVCFYKDVPVQHFMQLAIIISSVILVSVGFVEYREIQKLHEQEDGQAKDVFHWTKKIRYLQYDSKVLFWSNNFHKNVWKWLVNEVEILKLFYDDPAHYTTKVEACSVLFLTFAWNVRWVTEFQLELARGVKVSPEVQLLRSLTELTIPSCLISSAVLINSSIYERVQLTWRNRGALFYLSLWMYVVSFGCAGCGLWLLIIASARIPYTLNPYCTLFYMIEFGFIYPAIFKMCYIYFKMRLKWRIEVEGDQSCILRWIRFFLGVDPQKIILSEYMLDILTEKRYTLHSLQRFGIEFNSNLAEWKERKAEELEREIEEMEDELTLMMNRNSNATNNFEFTSAITTARSFMNITFRRSEASSPKMVTPHGRKPYSDKMMEDLQTNILKKRQQLNHLLHMSLTLATQSKAFSSKQIILDKVKHSTTIEV